MNIYLQYGIGIFLLILAVIAGRLSKRNPHPNGNVLLNNIFQSNRELDSSIAMGCTFFGFFLVIGAISSLTFRAIPIPEQLWNLVNMFENFILMILSSFFTKATMNNTPKGES